MMHGWKRKRLENGVGRYVYVDEDLGEELMMPPTDIVLLEDPKFGVWVERYARDKDLFFADFVSVLARLTELSIRRDESGRITNTDNEKGRHLSAPKRPIARCVGEVVWEETIRDEAWPLKKNRGAVGEVVSLYLVPFSQLAFQLCFDRPRPGPRHDISHRSNTKIDKLNRIFR
jgi:hypothetical protein